MLPSLFTPPLGPDMPNIVGTQNNSQVNVMRYSLYLPPLGPQIPPTYQYVISIRRFYEQASESFKIYQEVFKDLWQSTSMDIHLHTYTHIFKSPY